MCLDDGGFINGDQYGVTLDISGTPGNFVIGPGEGEEQVPEALSSAGLVLIE